jgi:hypothetical protein
MHLYVINPRVLLRNGHLTALFEVTFICIFLLTSCVGSSSKPNVSISVHSDESAADGNNVVGDINYGPTILLSYSREGFKKNPIASFMYFVPLISPKLVDRETSSDNEQQVGIISYRRKVTLESFNVVCETEMSGKGFHKNTFDSAGLTETHTDELEKGESLINMLDYIKFEGEGFGLIEVKGTMTGSIPTVTEVDLHFNARGSKSPVTVSIYDIKPKDGQYNYENRSNQIVARVNSLIFKKTEKTPRMGIELASIRNAAESEDFVSGLKGILANIFIRPPKVSELGNETMLNFGRILLEQKSSFTFPKAINIKESRIVELEHIQK